MARPLSIGSARGESLTIRLPPEDRARLEQVRALLDAADRDGRQHSMGDAVRYVIRAAPDPGRRRTR